MEGPGKLYAIVSQGATESFDRQRKPVVDFGQHVRAPFRVG